MLSATSPQETPSPFAQPPVSPKKSRSQPQGFLGMTAESTLILGAT